MLEQSRPQDLWKILPKDAKRDDGHFPYAILRDLYMPLVAGQLLKQ